MIDLEAIKAQYEEACIRSGEGCIADLNRANALANHVPELVAELESLREGLRLCEAWAAAAQLLADFRAPHRVDP